MEFHEDGKEEREGESGRGACKTERKKDVPSPPSRSSLVSHCLLLVVSIFFFVVLLPFYLSLILFSLLGPKSVRLSTSVFRCVLCLLWLARDLFFRIRELKDVYEGEVLEVAAEETENPHGGFGISKHGKTNFLFLTLFPLDKLSPFYPIIPDVPLSSEKRLSLPVNAQAVCLSTGVCMCRRMSLRLHAAVLGT